MFLAQILMSLKQANFRIVSRSVEIPRYSSIACGDFINDCQSVVVTSSKQCTWKIALESDTS